MLKTYEVYEYVTPKEAAKLLNKSPTTIRRWCTEKKIEAVKDMSTGYWHISKKTIDELMKK